MLPTMIALYFFLIFSSIIFQSDERVISYRNFEITYHKFPPQAIEAFSKAVEIWEEYIQTNSVIKINAYFEELEGAKGITIPNGIINFAKAPMVSTWYTSALADAISGHNLQPGFADMDIFINSKADWYYGSDRKNPPFKYEMVSVVMHEIGHGLGIISLADVKYEVGSFSLQTEEDLLVPISFPMPELDGMPIVFDRFIANQQKKYFVEANNPSVELKEFFTGDNLFFFGENTINSNSGLAPKLESNGEYRKGSSVAHFDENYFEPNDDDALMTPKIGRGEIIKKPGPVTLGVLKDIGWELKIKN